MVSLDLDESRFEKPCPSVLGAHKPAVRPVIDWVRCEGEAVCAKVCPYDVFEIQRMEEADEAALPFWVALRPQTDAPLTAYAPRADRCHGCGACVDACPSRAITLVAVEVPPTQ